VPSMEFADEAIGVAVVGEGRPLWVIDDDPRRGGTGEEPFRATAVPPELEPVAAVVAAAVALEAVGLTFALLLMLVD
jgi:hypothetical protein